MRRGVTVFSATLGAAVFGAALAGSAHAADPLKIGVPTRTGYSAAKHAAIAHLRMHVGQIFI